jgi:translation initiation factor IF-2
LSEFSWIFSPLSLLFVQTTLLLLSSLHTATAQLSARHKEAQQEALSGPTAPPAAVAGKATPRGHLNPETSSEQQTEEVRTSDFKQQELPQQPKQVLRLVIKADVQGSMEAVTGMVRKLAGDRVDLKVGKTVVRACVRHGRNASSKNTR